MNFSRLARRGLVHYWRTNLAVVGGIAIAVAVLGGALLVGESVRDSLRRIATGRLGNTHSTVTSPILFREDLAERIGEGVPVLALDGVVTHQSSGRRAGQVAVYGVDERFWKFHGWADPQLGGRAAAATSSLLAELGALKGETLLLKVEKPADIPAESLFGRKDDAVSSIRLTLSGQTRDFSLRSGQGPVRTLFVPLSLLQRETGNTARANTILLDKRPGKLPVILDDLGLRITPLAGGSGQVQLDSRSGVLTDAVVRAAGEGARKSFVYLATSIKLSGREVPYSLIAAADLSELPVPVDNSPDAIVLNEWAARSLGAKAGDEVIVEYLIWHDDGRATTESARFRVAAITSITGLAADRRLAPEYPGITDSDDVSDWDPPFPMDLGRIRPTDEDYWDRYRTTPKAWIPFERGRELWASRWGSVTAVRMKADPLLEQRLLDRLTPRDSGITVIPLREQALMGSSGATDFGEYFSYFSFFLMVSALLLAGLFFRLGVEQRLSEIGLLEAIGFTAPRVFRLFLFEGLGLSLAGAALGVACSLAYAAAILFALRTWWLDAVGTRELELDLAAGPLAVGATMGVVAAMLSVAWVFKNIRSESPRSLLQSAGLRFRRVRSRAGLSATGLAVIGFLFLAAAGMKRLPAAGGFFGAGASMLAAAIFAVRHQLETSGNVKSLPSFAFRNAAIRPGRSALVVALIASATFIIVSVEAFRRNAASDAGSGGYALMAESVHPLYLNLNEESARQDLNISGLDGVTFMAFRLRPGDDASCLNLYRPQNPRVLGAPVELLNRARFRFASVENDSPNPWLKLDERLRDGTIPAIVDVNSMTYVLHRKLGEVIELPGTQVRLRLVAALSDSVFQSELIISEEHFKQAFPAEQGYRVFLIDSPPARVEEVTSTLESALADYGFDISSTAERLASFHRVENAYLSTFQSLGVLGLLLGTIGVAAILIRNVLERRREVALLSAVGFAPQRLRALILAENLLTLLAGIGAGAACALLAVAPALAARGAGPSIASQLILLAAVAAAGFIAVFVAARIALGLPLLASLRSE
jgi:ABC-type antimicrobial peptide transport system permease subunit